MTLHEGINMDAPHMKDKFATDLNTFAEDQLVEKLATLWDENRELREELQGQGGTLEEGGNHRDIREEISTLRRSVSHLSFDLRQYLGNIQNPKGIPVFPLDAWDTGAAGSLENYHRRLAKQEKELNDKKCNVGRTGTGHRTRRSADSRAPGLT